MNLDEQTEFLRLFFDRFAGRLDTYAIRVEGKDRPMYLPSRYEGDSEWSDAKVKEIVGDIGTDEYTEEVIRAHLEGRYLIGVYPINSEGKCHFFALDFDGKNGDPYKEARAQASILLVEAGLPVRVERSQSGNGYHVWGFLDQPVEAFKIRHALKPFIEDTATFDRMFPNQDGISETRPLGNLIALPFAGSRVEKGNSTFVRKNEKGEVVPIDDPMQFLKEVPLVKADRIEELFKEAGDFKKEREVSKYEGTAEGLPEGWKVTHEKFGCDFMRWAVENPEQVNEPLWHAIACNLAQLADGRELFHQISSADIRRYDERATNKKYDQAVKQNKPHTCETIRSLGGPCDCDTRFPGKVTHPFDLAKLSFKVLVESVTSEEGDEGSVIGAAEGFAEAIAWMEAVERDPSMGSGYRYGIKGLDDATGLRNSDLVILGARPAMGKTAFMNTIADNTCMAGVPNYVFSAEMSRLQLFKRQMATRAGVSATRMTIGKLSKQDWQKIREAQKLVQNIENYPLYVDDMSRSVERIFEVAARLVHEHGKGIIWIDYLQLLQRQPKESMFDQVTRIVHALKLLAKALDCPVVALTQLNRTADDTTAESQTMDSHLRGSGDIEQAADVIIFLLGDKGPNIQARLAAIHKERHREGGIRVDMEFNQPLMRFADKGTWGTETPKPQIKKREDAPTVEPGTVAMTENLEAHLEAGLDTRALVEGL